MDTTTRAFSLPTTHVAALVYEADRSGMTPDQALKQAITLYQTVQIKARSGLTMAFVDDRGNVIRDMPAGLPAFD